MSRCEIATFKFTNFNDFDNYLRCLNQLIIKSKEKNKKVSIIFDARKVNSLPTTMNLVKQAAFIVTNEKSFKEVVNKTSIVLPESEYKNIIEKVFTLKAPLRPNKVTTNIQEAMDFLLD